jgi:hypothetical protein
MKHALEPGTIRAMIVAAMRGGTAGMASTLCRIATLTGLCLAAATPAGAANDESDYPTAARAEYVFACMVSNGQTQDALRRCSCSIDVIATVLPYDKYEQAETVLRMRRSSGGYLGEVFRSVVPNDMVRDLQEAQAEAEIRCF